MDTHMSRRDLFIPSRRRFLGIAAGTVMAPMGVAVARDDLPRVTNPRSTSGDAVEPNWDERLTITVGNANADLVGADEKVLQAAVDYMVRAGGGTVRVLPGTYKVRNAVYLQSRVRILG